MSLNALNLIDHGMISCHDSNYLKSCHDSCHEEKLSKSDWFYLVGILESWRVFNPRSVIKHYGPLNCWEAMIRTKDFGPRVPGAYFTKVVRQLSGINTKEQKAGTKAESNIQPKKMSKSYSEDELFKDYRKACNFLCALSKNDLRNPEILQTSEALRKRWNIG